MATDASRPETPGNNDRGLECRGCGCKHFRVVYTRPYRGGSVVRRRECRYCGRRMTTVEKAFGQVSAPSTWIAPPRRSEFALHIRTVFPEQPVKNVAAS